MTTFSFHFLEHFRELIRNIFHSETPEPRSQQAASAIVTETVPEQQAPVEKNAPVVLSHINLEQVLMPTAVFAFDPKEGVMNIVMAQPGSKQFGFKIMLNGLNEPVLQSAINIVAGSFDATEMTVERFQARLGGNLLFASGNHMLEDALLRSLMVQSYENAFLLETEFEFQLPVLANEEPSVFDDVYIQHYEGSSVMCWKLANNDEVDYLEFQYSMDGKSFKTVSQLNPSLLYAELPHNLGYYRLLANMKDESTRYSEVLNASGEQGILGIIAVPQPMQSELLVGFSLQTAGVLDMKLIFQDGKVMARNQAYMEVGPGKVVFNAIEDLPMGNYQLQVRHGAHLYMKSVFKCCVC